MDSDKLIMYFGIFSFFSFFWTWVPAIIFWHKEQWISYIFIILSISFLISFLVFIRWLKEQTKFKDSN